ncbi:MAG: D-alanine--D-alanine ligase [Helicobacter sp.]|nr:D-alanine--D-alanine ligase [Helicobacter sp.]
MTILFGGASFEHEISIVSAITLKNVLKDEIDNFIFLDLNRDLYLIQKKNMNASFFADLKYKNELKLSFAKNGFEYTKILKRFLKVDLLLNLIHGKDGEDGLLASLLNFYGIKFIGPRIESSAISFNKELTKIYASSRNVRTLPYEVLHLHSTRQSFLGYPIIIKPLRGGSSIGIKVATNAKEFDYALDHAFGFDTSVIIEPFLKNVKEYNLAGSKTKNGFIFSSIEEPKKSDLLSFEDKYLDFSRSEKITAASLNKDIEEELKAFFIKIYDGYFDGALIRCDFFVHDGEVLLNEINPIPGSLANYLFDDFKGVLNQIELPKQRQIQQNYSYINKIKKAK